MKKKSLMKIRKDVIYAKKNFVQIKIKKFKKKQNVRDHDHYTGK